MDDWNLMKSTKQVIISAVTRGSRTTSENEKLLRNSQEPIRGRCSWKCWDTPLGPLPAWRMNLSEKYLLNLLIVPATEVGNNEKSQLKNRREVKKRSCEEVKGRSGRLNFHSRRMESGEFFFTSRGRMHLPSAKQPIAPRQMLISRRIKAYSEVV